MIAASKELQSLTILASWHTTRSSVLHEPSKDGLMKPTPSACEAGFSKVRFACNTALATMSVCSATTLVRQ